LHHKLRHHKHHFVGILQIERW